MRRTIVVLSVAFIASLLVAQDSQRNEQRSDKTASPAKEIEGLIEKLGAEEFAEREAAMKRLIEIGRPAVDALRKALESDDPEVVWRARKALEKILGEENGDYEPERKFPFPWGKGFLPPDDWFEELRKETEKMREETLKELRRLFPEAAKEMEEMERRFGKLPRLPEPPLPEGFDELFKRMKEVNRRLKKMLEETKKGREGVRSSRAMHVIVERKTSKEPGKPSSFKLRIYVWKNGRLLRKEEREFFEGKELVGLSLKPVPEVLRYHLNLKETEGVLVEDIDEESPFYRGGLRRNDIVLKVDDKPVKDYKSFMEAVVDRGEVKMMVLKEGERAELKVVFPKEEK